MLHVPREGEPAPAFALESIDGGTVTEDTLPGPLALVFLRHLA